MLLQTFSFVFLWLIILSACIHSGETCNRTAKQCGDGLCRNGAICEDTVNGFKCYCPSGKNFVRISLNIYIYFLCGFLVHQMLIDGSIIYLISGFDMSCTGSPQFTAIMESTLTTINHDSCEASHTHDSSNFMTHCAAVIKRPKQLLSKTVVH